MDFENNGHRKSWKSHGILNGRRCTNPVLDIDACDMGIGAVLLQRHGEDEKVIAYAARSLLALVWSMEHFASYLIEKPFKA